MRKDAQALAVACQVSLGDRVTEVMGSGDPEKHDGPGVPGPSGRRADVIAYIDGFNLYHGLRDRYQHRYLWLDLTKLVRHLRPRDSIVAVRYFTAVVRNDPSAQARQQAYLSALQAHDGSCRR